MELVEKMLKNFQELGAKMSIKVHLLYSHLDSFPNNCGDFSEEQGKRFHQDIKTMEERYQGRRDTKMMADHCWSTKRDLTTTEYRGRESFCHSRRARNS